MADPITSTGGMPFTATHEVDAVLLEVGRGTTVRFEPAAAAALGQQLIDEAQNAIHAERVGRRKT
ncbi:hypothetical protein [Curtobacterium sp. MCBA15_004]|uniref:hypothetical protein n=1 Tax=Curtobacterium sp. MCBA15_004 TaxID=1898733 RepID=UPI0008DCEAA2|nr:hypothetical protein [Curtobacterium sp. MCBA15_004]WIA96432.1 hypothetical protein QOL16_15240 [Curtobacterium sp. MCBA15_004]